MTFPKRLTSLLLLVCAGCATTPSTPAAQAPAPAAPPAAQAPAPGAGLTVRQALAREVDTGLTRTRVESPEAPLRGEVLAAGPVQVQARPNGIFILTVPLGTLTPVTCFLYPQPIDAAAAARLLVGSLLEDVRVERVRATEVKSYAGVPALYLEGDYSREGHAGRLKLMVYADPVLPKACFHEELGYARTFQQVTATVAASLSSADAKPPVTPYFSDVQVTRVGEQVLGYQYTALFHAQAGGTVQEVNTVLVRPGNGTTAAYLDTSVEELADEQGRLQLKSYKKRVGDTVAADMALRRGEDGGYEVLGQMDGKDVKARLTGELVGEVGLARRVRDGLLKNGSRVEVAMWVPPASVSAPTRMVVSPLADAGPRAAVMETDGMRMKVKLDVHGFIERGEVSAGANTMVLERLSQTGTP